MNRHRTTWGWVAFTASLLVAIWLPATSHSLLELTDWIHSDHDSSNASNHEAADGHCRLENGGALLKAPTLAAQPDLAIFAPRGILPVTQTHFLQGLVAFVSTAPPGLAAPWQFSHRTACPNQAPPILG